MKKFIPVCLLLILVTLPAVAFTGCESAAGDEWSGLSDIKVPWGDYEEALYKYTVDGKAADDIKFIVEKSELNGVEVSNMQDPLLLTMTGKPC